MMHFIILFLSSNLINISTSFVQTTTHKKQTKLSLFKTESIKVPKSLNERDTQAIQSIQNAIKTPKTKSFPLIECEFPPLASLNKLGDGSLRSAIEVEEANIAFMIKLSKSVMSPLTQLFTKKIAKLHIITSTSSSNSFYDKVRSRSDKSMRVISLKNGIPSNITTNDLCIFPTPSTSNDYKTAQTLARNGIPSIIINGYAKDTKSIPSEATMAYYLKPLTYNSQIAGYLLRCYPNDWITISSTSVVLNTEKDGEILVKGTNTPDLRASVSLVSKFVGDFAIQSRQ